MTFEASMTLEEQIKLLAAELERTQSDLRALARKHRRKHIATRSIFLAGFVVMVLAAGGSFMSASTAQNEAPRPTTILEAPVEIRGKSGQTIVHIGDESGRYGLSVFSPNAPSGPNGSTAPAASVGLGFETGSGSTTAMVLLKEGPNFTAKMGRDGLRLYKTNQPVAYLGISAGGNGELQLGNPTGASLVEAGALDSNTGVVRVYPFGATPIPIPTFLRGMKKQ